QLAGAPAAVLEVDHERVDDLGNVLDNRVELACAEPDPTAVQGGVGAPGDHAAATLGELDPVSLAPDARIAIEVGAPIALAVRVVPEPDRHRGHRLSDHHLAELADRRVVAVLVVGVDVDGQAPA